MHAWVVGLGAVVAMCSVTSTASACSCVGARMSRMVVPIDGTEAFPTNGIIRVYLTAFPEALRSRIASEYRLVGPEGNVALRNRVVGTRLDLIPQSPLAASTAYTLEQVHAYNNAGALLSDSERAIAQGNVRGAWFGVTSFTTAAGPAPSRTRPLTMASAGFDFRFGGGDCGPGVSLNAEVQLPQPLRDTDLIELRVFGLGVVRSAPLITHDPTTRIYASNTMCNPDPVNIGWSRGLQIEVVLVDAAGHELGSTGRQVPAGTPARPGWDRQRSSRMGDLPAWNQIRMVTPAVQTSGPAACPHGFEVTESHPLVERGGPWMYGARSSLDGGGRRAWVAFQENETGPPARIVELSAGRRTHALRPYSVPISGIPRALAAGRRGPFVLAQTYTRGGGDTNTSLYAVRGRRIAWSRELGDGDAWRIALGSERVIAGWRHNGTLNYAMFNARTGAPSAAPVRTSHTIHRGSSEGAALAHVGDRFIFAWTPEGRDDPMKTMVVNTSGQARDAHAIDMRGAGIPDMVGAANRAALVNSNRGQIQWAMLDSDGRLSGQPIVVSTGRDNRIPRIAYNGEFFAVGWETHPTGGVYVVAVDAEGHVSPVLRLDQGEPHAGSVGLTRTRSGFLASFTTNYQGTAVLRALRCRDNAARRAPASLTPQQRAN